MRSMMFSLGLALAAIILGAGVSLAGLLVLTDGTAIKGRVITRFSYVTVHGSDQKLYQFPTYMVHRAEVFPPTGTNTRLALDNGHIYRNPDLDAGVVGALHKGMELVVDEISDEWARVRGVRESDNGWISADLLGGRVEWNPLNPDAEEPDVAEMARLHESLYGEGSPMVPLPGPREP